MKLWIGGEIEADTAEAFRSARSEVEKQVNDVIAEKHYSLPLGGWDCIAIIRSDSQFAEVVKYSPKKKDMDFRLIINHGEFKEASEQRRKAMICEMLLRSLSLLEKKGVPIENLRKDYLHLIERKEWILT